jgi:hypothetical protein
MVERKKWVCWYVPVMLHKWIEPLPHMSQVLGTNRNAIPCVADIIGLSQNVIVANAKNKRNLVESKYRKELCSGDNRYRSMVIIDRPYFSFRGSKTIKADATSASATGNGLCACTLPNSSFLSCQYSSNRCAAKVGLLFNTTKMMTCTRSSLLLPRCCSDPICCSRCFCGRCGLRNSY